MSALIHFIGVYQPQADALVAALAVAGIIVMVIAKSSTQFKQGGKIGLVSILLSWGLFYLAGSAGDEVLETKIEARAIADCSKFGGIPAKGGVSDTYWQTYCVILIPPTQPRTESRFHGPDEAFSKKCLTHGDTLVYLPYGHKGWGCGLVIAFGTQPKAGEPYVFSPLVFK